MKKSLFLLVGLVCTITYSNSQDTFSIVAVDTVTGEVGSAGASCIDGSIIISDLHPGRGAIHTQAYYFSSNQSNASARMDSGDSPQEIIDWLVANDATGNPTYRQYGVVDVDSSGSPRSAGYTGSSTDDYKNHITGPNYAIQGNILLGQQILDSIEAGFLNTSGSLTCKLMAALQGANVPGADTRCLTSNKSSKSAFIRVAKPGDTTGTYSLDINVNQTPFAVEPIDSLQGLFNDFLITPAFSDSTFGLSVFFFDSSVTATAWNWDFGDGQTSQFQNPIYTYANPDTYTVCLTAYNECAFNTICENITVIPVGVGELSQAERVRIYPNPTHGKFVIELNNDLMGSTIKIIDELGALVEVIKKVKQNKIEIDISHHSKGIYCVHIENEKSAINKTIVNK